MSRNTGTGKKSVLLRFFLSYLYLLVFTLLISSLFHLQTANILKKENNRANNAILKQFSNALEDKFLSMSELAVQAYIGAQSELQSQNNLSSYERYRICKNLNQLNTAAQTNIENLFIYYSEQRYIAGLKSSVPADIFYEAYYRKNGFSMEEWNNALRTSSGFTAFPAKTGAISIAFVYSPFQQGKKERDKVFVCFNPSRLRSILCNSKWESNGAFLVFNGNGNLLTSTDSAYNDMNLRSYFDRNGFFDMKHDGKEYTCKIIQSAKTDCYYASVTPKAVAVKPVTDFRNKVLLFSVLLFCVGMWIAYILSRQNYAPLKKLIDWVDEKAMYDPKSFETGNEIDILEKVLQLSFQDQENLIVQIQNKKKDLLQSSIRNLLCDTSSPTQGNSIQDIFAKNDIPLLSDQYAVILINTDEKYSHPAVTEALDTGNLFTAMTTNTMDKLSGNDFQSFVVPMDKEQCALLINFAPLIRETIMQETLLFIAREVKTSLKSSFGMPLTISLSNIHTENEENDGIQQAFQEAQYAMEYRLTIGFNQIIPYQEKQEDGSIYTFSFQTDHFISLFLKEPRSSGEIGQFVSALFTNKNIDSHVSPGIAKDFIYDVSGSLSKAVTEKMMDADTEWKKGIFYRLLQCDTLTQFRSELIDILNKYQEYLHKKPELYSVGAQIKTFISRNFSDPALSLNALSSEFNLSTSHLSRTFKETNGISISDYISICRITHARELLRDSDKTVQQIAAETGFLSSSVFIRVFKKAEGVTPGSYRKLENQKRA
jgi:AraC-like DNA-binding protein